MTVTYTCDVSTVATKSFLKTIFRWRGSLWKLVWHELLIWSVVYAIFSVVYRTALDEEQKKTLELVCSFLFKFGDFIPFSFMLGYYVTLVVSRWQKQFNAIGWMDKSLMLVSIYVRGRHERARIYRRSVARYMCLLQALVFRSICVPVRKRFPTIDSLVEAGYIHPDEKIDLADTKYWLPIKWSMQMIEKAKEEGLISSDNALHDIYLELTNLRVQILSLWLSDWVPVPLCYTQVVFLSVRIYFIMMLLGRQYLNADRYSSKHPVDAYVPFLTMIQFVIYIGWLKVAEALLNPFGEDDDDFECNWILDRNFQVALQMAEMGTENAPQLEKDINWDKEDITPLYSEETVNERQNGAIGSASLMDIPTTIMVSMENIHNIPHNNSIMSRVSTAIRSLTGQENEKNSMSSPYLNHFTKKRMEGRRRGSLDPPRKTSISSFLGRNSTRKWSIGSHTSLEYELSYGDMNELPSKTFKPHRFVRNYSDIAEGQEEDEQHENVSGGLEDIEEMVVRRRRIFSEGGSEPQLQLDKINMRKVKSNPELKSLVRDHLHLLFPKGGFDM